MTPPDLHAMGFDFASWEDFFEAILQHEFPGIQDFGPFEFLGMYRQESGAGVGVVKVRDEPPFTLPALTSPHSHKVRAYLVAPTLAVVEVLTQDDEIQTIILATVNDPHQYPLGRYGDVEEPGTFNDYQLSGAAIDVKIYVDEEEFYKSQGELVDGGSGTHESEALYGATFIASPWLFELKQGEFAPPAANSCAMFNGVIIGVEKHTNEITGVEWFKAEVDCGFLVTVALPGDVEVEPQPGNVISGNVMMLGTTGFWD